VSHRRTPQSEFWDEFDAGVEVGSIMTKLKGTISTPSIPYFITAYTIYNMLFILITTRFEPADNLLVASIHKCCFRATDLLCIAGRAVRLPASHRGGRGSRPRQSMWDLWWTKWQTFLRILRFCYINIIHRCSIFAHVSFGSCTMGPLEAVVPQRHSLTPS
jgi:hypothetical protein